MANRTKIVFLISAIAINASELISQKSIGFELGLRSN